MKRILCLVMLSALLAGCVKPQGPGGTDQPAVGGRGFSVHRVEVSKMFEAKGKPVESRYYEKANIDVKINKRESISIALDYDENYYLVYFYLEFVKLQELPETVAVDLMVEMVNAVAKTPITKADILDLVGEKDKKKYYNEEFDDDDLISKSIDIGENSIYLNIDQIYDGCLNFGGTLDPNTAILDSVEKIKNICETVGNWEFSFDYDDYWLVEYEDGIGWYVDLATGDLKTVDFDNRAFEYTVSTYHYNDQGEIALNDRTKYIDEDFFLKLVNHLGKVQGQGKLLSAEKLKEFIADNSNKYGFEDWDDDEDYGVTYKYYNSIPELTGTLMYYIDSYDFNQDYVDGYGDDDSDNYYDEEDDEDDWDDEEWILNYEELVYYDNTDNFEEDDEDDYNEDDFYLGTLTALDSGINYRSGPKVSKKTAIGKLKKNKTYKVIKYLPCDPFKSGKYQVLGWYVIEVKDDWVFVANVKKLVSFQANR